MILSFIFFVFLFYLLYKLVFDFVVPIYKTTKQVKKSFREMHQRMSPNDYASASKNGTASKDAAPKKRSSSDYIDFEEVKD